MTHGDTVEPMTTRPAIANGLTSRETLLDALIFAVTVVALLADVAVTPEATMTWLAFVTAFAGASPVLLRRRFPVWAFVAALALIMALLQFAAIYSTIALPAVICGYTLAKMRGRRIAIAAAAAALPLTVGLMMLYSPHPLLSMDSLMYLASVALPLALGVASHERHARLDALVSRANEAERTREEETKRRVNEDRLHIARDVHDVVAHTLVAINVQAGVGARLFGSQPDIARQSLNDIKSVSGKALTDLRSILGVLRDPDAPESSVDATIHPTRGLAELEDLTDALDAAGVTLSLDVNTDARDLPAGINAIAFRIAQEALTNVMRHAGPTTARVSVTRTVDAVTVTIDNDASAQQRPPDTSGAGHGLRGMRERAFAVGGELTAGPQPAGGWQVQAVLPLERS